MLIWPRVATGGQRCSLHYCAGCVSIFPTVPECSSQQQVQDVPPGSPWTCWAPSLVVLTTTTSLMTTSWFDHFLVRPLPGSADSSRADHAVRPPRRREALATLRCVSHHRGRIKSRRDVGNFDKEFTKMAVELTPTDKLFIMNLDQNEFQGFSYTNPEFIIQV
ncbi:uncharacterized protein V6R79_004316 [Siganus canaliculatus]